MTRHHNKQLDTQSPVIEGLAASLRDAFGHDTRIQQDSENSDYLDDTSSRPDAVFNVETPSKNLRIFVKAINTGYPRDIREAIWRLDSVKGSSLTSVDTVKMVAAETLSPGAKRDLKERGIAFFELGGSLFLKHGLWLINVQKPATPSVSKRAIKLFTGARENVIHALMKHNNQWLTGIELAELADTSQYTCSLVLQELTLREWSKSVGGGPTKRRSLIAPGPLLDAWAEAWKKRQEKISRWYTFVEDPKLLLSHLTDQINRQGIDFPWAFTGTAAANVFAPLLTSTDSAEIIVPSGYTEQMAKALNLKPAEKGANVTLIERDGASLLFLDMHPDYHTFFASPYILYLDLLNGQGRNKELADHIRRILEAQWKR